MRIKNKWHKELKWWIQERVIILLGKIRFFFNRCPDCGGKLYWWKEDKVYCNKCKWRS